MYEVGDKVQRAPSGAGTDDIEFGMLVLVRSATRTAAFLGDPPNPQDYRWSEGSQGGPTTFSAWGLAIRKNGQHGTRELIRSGLILAGRLTMSKEPNDPSDTIDIPVDHAKPWRGNPEPFTYTPPPSPDPGRPDHPYLLKAEFTVRYSGTLLWRRSEHPVLTLVQYHWEAGEPA